MFRKWVFAPCGNRATRKYPAKYLRAQVLNRLRLRLGDRVRRRLREWLQRPAAARKSRDAHGWHVCRKNLSLNGLLDPKHGMKQSTTSNGPRYFGGHPRQARVRLVRWGRQMHRHRCPMHHYHCIYPIRTRPRQWAACSELAAIASPK